MSSGFINLSPLSQQSWRAPVANASVLPTVGNSVGDVIVTQNNGDLYEWNGSSWNIVGGGGPGGITQLTGDVTASGTGTVAATVAFVDGVSALNVANGATAANAATSADTVSTIVKRDSSGSFNAGAVSVASLAATGAVTGSNLSGTNTGDVTLGTADGLSLTGQVLSLALASTSTTGALNSTDWNTFNNKQGALTPGAISTSTTGVTVGNGAVSTVGPNVTVNVQTANTSQPGLLSAADWNTFNSKQSTLTFGNLTDVGTDGIVVTNGTGAVVGSGTSFAQAKASGSQNGYLASTDWSTFNNKGSVSSIAVTVPSYLTVSGSPITTAGTIAITGTSEAQNLFLASPNGSAGVLTPRAIVSADLPDLSSTYVTQSEVGAVNGVASLDSGGHIPLSQLPPTLVEYLGTWDASTNTPILANGTGTSGQFYIVSVAGTVNFGAGNITFNVGDWVLYNGSIWERAVQSNIVQSVNGQTGVVTVNAINQLTGDVTTSVTSGSQSKVASLVATSNGTLTTLSALSLPGSQVTGDIAGNSANVTGTVAIANGGTGQITAQLAINALAGAVTSGDYLRGNGTNVVMSAIQIADVPILNQNTTGTASNITATTNSTLTTLSALSLPYSQVTGTPTPLVFGDSVVNTAGTVTLVNDTATPAASNYYGTSAGGVLGYHTLPAPGTGTVTSVSVVSANGFAGSVANPTTTPAITLTGTLTGDITGTLNSNTLTATTNNTLTSLPALSLPSSQVTGLTNGTVTSVAFSDASTIPIYTITGSPVTTSGTLTQTLTTQAANAVFVGPTTGSAAQPTFRALLVADIPALPYVSSAVGDIAPSSFSLANNQSSAANVTGLSFSNSTVRSATVFYAINIAATPALYEAGTLQLVQKTSSWEMSQTDVGDNSQVVFTVTSDGQIQYTTPSYTGFSLGTVRFRANTL